MMEELRVRKIISIDDQIAFIEERLKQARDVTNGGRVEVATVSFEELDQYLAEGWEIVASKEIYTSSKDGILL